MTTLQLGPALSACRWTRRQHGVRLRRRGVVLRRRRRPDSLPRHGLIVCGGVTSRCILLLASTWPSLCFNIQCAHSMSDITDDRVTTSSVFVKLRRLCFSGPSSFLPTSSRSTVALRFEFTRNHPTDRAAKPLEALFLCTATHSKLQRPTDNLAVSARCRTKTVSRSGGEHFGCWEDNFSSLRHKVGIDFLASFAAQKIE